MKITPSRKTKPRYKRNKTVKRAPYSLVRNYGSRVTVQFLEMLLLIKLFHWKTHSYAIHKATDELYGTLNENMDKFIEILLGKTDSRLDFSGRTTITLSSDVKSTEELQQRVMKFKVFLIELSDSKELSPMTNTDLMNIRDEILGDLNQFLYLLSLK
jgi:hypothetical protein